MKTLKGGNPIPEEIEYHRKPTAGEIKFGHGATHYLSFPPKKFLTKDNDIKKRIKGEDGLIYTL